jgi:hypothetical protein
MRHGIFFFFGANGNTIKLTFMGADYFWLDLRLLELLWCRQNLFVIPSACLVHPGSALE